MSEASPPYPLSAAPPRGPSRRWFLAVGAAGLLGAGGGVLAGLQTARRAPTPPPPPPPRPPQALLAAAEAERALIADLDATTGGVPDLRRVIAQVRDDHAAHLRALVALLGQFEHVPVRERRRRHVPARKHRRPRGTPRTLAQLRAAERRAATAAAEHASALDGGYAALLASVAACEATHAELLK
jgi:hypothetical protein